MPPPCWRRGAWGGAARWKKGSLAPCLTARAPRTCSPLAATKPAVRSMSWCSARLLGTGMPVGTAHGGTKRGGPAICPPPGGCGGPWGWP
eukprot:scaffold60013_cov30-Phaeocystis_antarctica.AAC.1